MHGTESVGGAECVPPSHQQRSVCTWRCSSDTDGGTRPPPDKSVGGKGGPDCPERMEAAQTFDHQMASTFSLAFSGPWRQKEQFQAVFFFLNHFFTDLCVKALRQGRETLALDPGQDPPQMDAIGRRMTSLMLNTSLTL